MADLRCNSHSCRHKSLIVNINRSSLAWFMWFSSSRRSCGSLVLVVLVVLSFSFSFLVVHVGMGGYSRLPAQEASKM